MHPNTAQLKKQLASTSQSEFGGEVVKVLRDAYQGDTAYIVACGPSILEFDATGLRERLAGELVISIKQSYCLTLETTDFHLLNRRNLITYNYGPNDKSPLVVGVYSAERPLKEFSPNLAFPIIASGDLNMSLVRTREFHKWRLDESVARPWGPGIMYEIAFFLAAHLGVAKIVTMGWDLGARSDGTYPHFYDASTVYSSLKANQERHPDPVSHEELIAFSYSWWSWLTTQNIELVTASRNTLIDPVIPRVSLFDTPPNWPNNA